MSAQFQLLSQQLLSKNLAESSVEELQSIVQRYPYFSAAQYFLAKKLKMADEVDYSSQLQKSSLHFYQPIASSTALEAEELERSFEWKREKIYTTEKHFVEENQPDEVIAFEEEPLSITEKSNAEENNAVEETEIEQGESFEPISVEEQEISEESEIEPDSEIEAVTENPQTGIQEDPEPALNEEPTRGFEKVLSFPSPSQNLITFEPYHTVDYFASQGIKLSKEESTDQMGRQLKSFTQWLKTMKRLPEAEQVKTLDPVSEKKVESMAAHSVETAQILTETMAEVWMKQGNKEKAIEVYNKLSLLNPYKKAYFATKVENLKNAL